MIRSLPKTLLASSDYPTTDGRPVAESDWRRELMFSLIATLQHWYAVQSSIYVSGNLLVFYERGNKRRHVSPDIFIARGVGNHKRMNYLIWDEKVGPEAVIELTSKSTRREDLEQKFVIYRDKIRVKEYFLFDPREDYLEPQLQGFRLRAGEYRPIRPVEGRLASQIFGLHLEADGRTLRFFDPITGARLATPAEELEREKERANRAEQEAERLRQELASLRRMNGNRR